MEGDGEFHMKPKALLIKRIYQKDNFTFVVEWSDGQTFPYRLSDLQHMCPCAACHERRKSHETTLHHLAGDEVKAVRIKSMGRYALRIHFTSGCSNGIYGFDFLHALGEKRE